jgi:UDP:flavonoid glycosyltransferase YjiC (YdhE family)
VKNEHGDRKKHVVIISPAFYSHFQPLLTLAKAFKRAGAYVTIGCTAAFQEAVLAAGVNFWEIEINRNANTGIAVQTQQVKTETRRIEAFIEATRSGPAATLMFQGEHRKADMLADPTTMQKDILRLAAHLQPDLFVVDQLSYSLTLTLHALEMPFITFCPGHPTYIPSADELFGVPYAWPANFQPDFVILESLKELAREVDKRFTCSFNEYIKQVNPSFPEIKSAFRLHSPLAVLFNYPEFGHLHQSNGGANKYFMGACFDPNPLDSEWKNRLAEQEGKFKILISLGTFLSARADVLERLILALQTFLPDAKLFVAAGASREALVQYESDSISISEFLPQTGLLPFMDLVIHHGGNNSFTETLYYGKPAIILPFSSDQFSIAHDAEMLGIAIVLDPNNFSAQQLQAAVNVSLRTETREKLLFWQHQIPRNGPDRAASSIMRDFTVRAE